MRGSDQLESLQCCSEAGTATIGRRERGYKQIGQETTQNWRERKEYPKSKKQRVNKGEKTNKEEMGQRNFAQTTQKKRIWKGIVNGF